MSFGATRFATSNFSFCPMVWLAGCFIGGIFAAGAIEFDWRISAAFCLAAAISTIVFIKRKTAVFFVFGAFVALGALCLQIEKSAVKPNRLKVLFDKNITESGTALKIIGVSTGKPELSIGGFFLTVRAESIIRGGSEQHVSGKIRLFAPVTDAPTAAEYEARQIAHGTKISAACELRREERFLNPGVASAKELLDAQDIDATCTIKNPQLLKNVGESESLPPLAWIYEQRQNLILEFKRRFSASTAGVLIASLLGNRHHLNKQTAESFREGGTFHILVISGLQITFIGGVMIFILRRLTRRKFLQFVLANTFLWAYALAVGADAPVVRAALMFTILHFALLVYRRGSLLNALGATALLILAWQPSLVFGQSFQLTFTCVAAIVAVGFPLVEKLRAVGCWRPSVETPVPPQTSKTLKSFCESLYWSETNWRRELARNVWQCVLFKSTRAAQLERLKLQKLLRYIFETLLVSAIVQIWLLPFSVVYFHRISFVSVFLNIWVGLLMAIESLTALAGVFVAPASELLAAPFIWATEILNWLVLASTASLVETSWASLRIPHYAETGKIVYLLYFLPLIALTVSANRWQPFGLTKNGKRKMKNKGGFQSFSKKVFASNNFFADNKFLAKISLAGLLVLSSLIVFHPFSAPVPDGRLRVDFLDVGQGDAALLTMPTGETLLVDGGGRANFDKLYVVREDAEPEFFEPDAQSVGETVVSRFLWEKGYDKVDFLLATHADTDHIQGLSDAAKNFRVSSAIIAGNPAKNAEFQNFQKVLESQNIESVMIARGDRLNFGSVKIEILSPQSNDSPETAWDNNRSIVLRVIYGDVKILLTGDIEKETERELMENPELLRATIVKVAHHGSKTSSTQAFVQATGAQFAVVSVGRDSPYGHPRPEIIERWRKAGAQILTTGEKGTITLTTDGKQLSIESYLK